MAPRRSALTTAYGILLAGTAVALVPFAYLVSTSLKDTNSLFSYPPDWIPSPLFWGNFTALFQDHPYVRWTGLHFVDALSPLAYLGAGVSTESDQENGSPVGVRQRHVDPAQRRRAQGRGRVVLGDGQTRPQQRDHGREPRFAAMGCDSSAPHYGRTLEEKTTCGDKVHFFSGDDPRMLAA